MAEDLHRMAVEAQATVGKGVPDGGLVVKAPQSGQPIQSPYLAIINRQGLIMLKAASELGFTPVSRPRTQVDPFALPGLDANGDEQGETAEASLDRFLDSNPDATLQ